MKDTRREYKWGEGRLIAAVLCLFAVLCVGMCVNRLPRKSVVQPVHAVSADLYDFVLVDINSATAEELMSLPGIGETLARRIIDERAENGPFQSPEDLLRVNGIGEGMLEKLRPFIKAV